MLLTIVTEHVTESAAPLRPAFRLLHWENETVAAEAGFALDCSTTALTPALKSMAPTVAVVS